MKLFLIAALFVSSMAFAADQAATATTTQAPATIQQGDAVNPSAVHEAQVTEQKKHHHKKKHTKPAPAPVASPAPAAK